MNAYEFLRKAFGESYVLSHNIHVQIEDRREIYQVVSISDSNVRLTGESSIQKQIGRSSLLSVIGVSFIRSTVLGGKTLITLGR